MTLQGFYQIIGFMIQYLGRNSMKECSGCEKWLGGCYVKINGKPAEHILASKPFYGVDRPGDR
jgi:hypothetical protein